MKEAEMRNLYKVDLLLEAPVEVPEGPGRYLLYRVELSWCSADVAPPQWERTRVGMVRHSRVGIHSEMLVVYLIKSEQ